VILFLVYYVDGGESYEGFLDSKPLLSDSYPIGQRNNIENMPTIRSRTEKITSG
jgi:hypothetical protein